jgi:hypothetical protein
MRSKACGEWFGVGCVRFVGCNWGFYLGVAPILFLDATYISGRESQRGLLKARQDYLAAVPGYPLLAPGWQSMDQVAQGHYPTHGLAKFVIQKPE